MTYTFEQLNLVDIISTKKSAVYGSKMLLTDERGIQYIDVDSTAKLTGISAGQVVVFTVIAASGCLDYIGQLKEPIDLSHATPQDKVYIEPGSVADMMLKMTVDIDISNIRFGEVRIPLLAELNSYKVINTI